MEEVGINMYDGKREEMLVKNKVNDRRNKRDNIYR
jgi:hypothetical protein